MAEIIGYLSLSSAVKIIWSSLNSGRRPSSAEYVGQVSEINIYPAKSFKGVQLQTAECTNRGLKYPGKHVFDRNFMVIDKSGTFVSGREYPKLSTLQTTLSGGDLVIASPGMSPLCVPAEPKHLSSLVDATVLGEAVQGHDCGDEAAQWISQFLGVSDLRLIHGGDGLLKRNLRKWLLKTPVNATKDIDKVTFQDLFPFLLTCESSLRELNERKQGAPVTMARFRPNIVISSNTEAFDEDNWTELWIGESKFSSAISCGRCTFTTVDPEKGVKDENQEPLRTLRKFRLKKSQLGGQYPLFGMNLVLDSSDRSCVNVGDAVYVLRHTQL